MRCCDGRVPQENARRTGDAGVAVLTCEPVPEGVSIESPSCDRVGGSLGSGLHAGTTKGVSTEPTLVRAQKGHRVLLGAAHPTITDWH